MLPKFNLGIGPRQHLESVDIETIINLPVGYNLNNHLSFWGLSYTFSQSIIESQTEYECIDNYINCKGPFTSIGLDAVGYYKSKQFNTEGNKPNIEFQFSTRQGGKRDIFWVYSIRFLTVLMHITKKIALSYPNSSVSIQYTYIISWNFWRILLWIYVALYLRFSYTIFKPRANYFSFHLLYIKQITILASQ